MRSKTITQSYSTKYTQQKSSFFAYVIPINNTSDCKQALKEIKQNHKADHYPYAYHLNTVNDSGELLTSSYQSDDGEPSHTAGSPLQQLITQHDLTNVIIIVARVFGGIKLGTSGLTKAFRESALLTLKGARLVKFYPTMKLTLTTSQQKVNSIAEFCRKNDVECSFDRQGEKVACHLDIPLEKKNLVEIAKSL